MRYGFFDDQAREYVIDRLDTPQSMTNYLGTQRMGTVISHNAGGYSWLDSPQGTTSTCGMTRAESTGR